MPNGDWAAFVPTDEQRQRVENLVAADFTNPNIALAMGIAQATLENHFREELNGGKNKVFADIAGQILGGARKGDRTFAIYASKARMGWRERTILIDGRSTAIGGNGMLGLDSRFSIDIED